MTKGDPLCVYMVCICMYTFLCIYMCVMCICAYIYMSHIHWLGPSYEFPLLYYHTSVKHRMVYNFILWDVSGIWSFRLCVLLCLTWPFFLFLYSFTWCYKRINKSQEKEISNVPVTEINVDVWLCSRQSSDSVNCCSKISEINDSIVINLRKSSVKQERLWSINRDRRLLRLPYYPFCSSY